MPISPQQSGANSTPAETYFKFSREMTASEEEVLERLIKVRAGYLDGRIFFFCWRALRTLESTR
jgi:hypothetical protein